MGRGYKKWVTHDRTVYLYQENHIPPPDYDVVVPVGGAMLMGANSLRLGLANPHLGRVDSDMYRRSGVRLILDSGGFQLASGTQEFIHPDEVVATYNEHAYIGMALDMPMASSLEPRFFDAVTRLMRLNDQRMIPLLKEDVILAVVSHGSTVERRRERLDGINRQSPVVAVAGLSAKSEHAMTFTNAVQNLLYVVCRYRSTCDYFHVLGTTSRMWYLVYGLLSASKFVRNIGGDSVTHLLGGATGRYPRVDFTETRLPIDGVQIPLTCGCPVCKTVGDSRILSRDNVLLSAHMLYVISQWVDYTQHLALQILEGRIGVRDALRILRVHPTDDYVTAVGYVIRTIGNGEFRPALQNVRRNGGIFNDTGKPANNQVSRYESMIRGYEAFYGKKIL